MRLLVSHPTGNTFVRALLETAYAEGVLESFHTTIAYRGGHWTEKLMPSQVRTQYERRAYPIPDNLIHRHPFRETVRLLAAKVGLARLTKHETGWASLDEVYGELDRKTAQALIDSEATHLHCYEDGALESFKLAQRLGMHRSYELPIAHWKTMRELLDKEAECRPEWAPTLVSTDDSQEKLARKDEELSLADNIVVPSQFVLDSLPATIQTSKTCILAPFGTPQVQGRKPRRTSGTPKKIRFLFAGSMGQRKGLGDLLEAFSKIRRDDVELIIMGTPMMDMEFYLEQFDGFTYEPPRPHSEVLELMQSCHVLALPSIAEGRALVQQEAMSQGMALLVTANAGGEDLVREGQTGFLVPVADPASIEEKVHWFADHPAETLQLGRNAQQHASRYTWENYAQAILDRAPHLDTQPQQG